MVLTFKLVVVWPDSKDATVSKAHGHLKRIDEIVGHEVNHASFPQRYKTGFTTYGPGGRFVQRWELLFAGSVGEVIGQRDRLSQLAQDMRDGGAGVQDTFVITDDDGRTTAIP